MLDAAIAELGGLPDPECEFRASVPSSTDDEIHSTPPYQRSVTIEFPDDCLVYPGARSLSIPIRDILEFFESVALDEERGVVREIRDLYYGEEYIDDYRDLSLTYGSNSSEQRGRMRWHLEQRRPDRENRNRHLLATLAAHEAEDAAKDRLRWEPFAEEKAAMETDEDALGERRRKLDLDWFDYFREADSRGTASDWAKSRRAELRDVEARLDEDTNSHFKKYEGLYDRSFEHLMTARGE